MMNIERVRFHAFGSMINRSFTFQSGLNIIQAPNESGKSTLLKGIYALLYGAAQEGLRVRREADWYSIYKPWLSEQYGGELYYQLGEISFQLVRNLQKGREQIQLINRSTGEELQDLYMFDPRKERKIAEKQLGLSGELYRRVAFLTADIPSGFLHSKQEQQLNQQLLDRLSILVKQGEEIELASITRYLDKQIEEIGRTEQAKQKPFGILSDKLAQLTNAIEQEQQLLDEGLQDRVELQAITQKQLDVEEKYNEIIDQQQRFSQLNQFDAVWFRYETIQQTYSSWQNSYRQQKKNQQKQSELVALKQELEPKFRMQLEDVEELHILHQQKQQIRTDIDKLKNFSILGHLQLWQVVLALIVTVGLSFFSLYFAGFAAVALIVWQVTKYYNKIVLPKRDQLIKNQEFEYKIDERLDWWESNVGTTEVETIRNWWKQTQAVEKVEWELEQITVLSSVSFKEGEVLRQQLIEYRDECSLLYQGNSCVLSEKGLDLQQLEQQREVLQQLNFQLTLQIAEKTAKVKQLDEQAKKLSELWTEWEQVNEKYAMLQKEKEAIQIAIDTWEAAAKKRRSDMMPMLLERSAKWINRITNNRYDMIYVDPLDPHFLSVYVSETGRKESVANLSTGTLMQMIFAVKIAIIQSIHAHTGIAIPILLDDCFSSYDDERLYSILPQLSELAKSHQIILCTCHTREQIMLNKLHIPYHEVSLIYA